MRTLVLPSVANALSTDQSMRTLVLPSVANALSTDQSMRTLVLPTSVNARSTGMAVRALIHNWVSGQSSPTSSSTITATGIRIKGGIAPLSGNSIITASSHVNPGGRVSITTSSKLVATGNVRYGATGSFKANPLVNGTASVLHNASCSARSSAGISATPLSSVQPLGRTFNYFLFDQGLFDGPSDGVPGYVQATANLTCVSSITSDAAVNLVPGSANLQSVASLTSDSVVVIGGAANLTCDSELMANPTAIVAGFANLTCDSELMATGTSLLIVAGAASITCVSTINAQTFQVYDEIGYGGVVVNGAAQMTHGFVEVGQGGVIVGGVGGVGAIVSVNVFRPCNKPPLPHHPKPSIADYRPQTVAPLIEFFRPIVSGVLGENVPLCDMVFRYENNTPCLPSDDIFVKHPTCIPVPYTPKPKPRSKSPEQLLYEQYAKKSQRLYDYMIASPARIRYFDGDVKHEIMPY